MTRTSATIDASNLSIFRFELTENHDLTFNDLEMTMTVATGDFVTYFFNGLSSRGLRAFAVGNGTGIWIARNDGDAFRLYGETSGGGRGLLSLAARGFELVGVGAGANSIGLNIATGDYHNCIGYAENGGTGIEGSTNTNLFNCYGFSSTGNGMSNVGFVENTVGESITGIGISPGQGTVSNSTARSSTGAGFGNVATGVQIHNSTGISFGNRGMQANAGGITHVVDNCSLISNWNNAGGHAYYNIGGTPAGTMTDCALKTTHVSANGIHLLNAGTFDYGNNSFDGPVGATLENAMTTQGITNVPDAQGNLTVR